VAVPCDPVRFELADRPHRLASVRLQQEIGLPEPLELTRAGRVWTLEVDRPEVDRIEYLFEVTDHNGHRWTILDPANPRRVGGAFGDKSVLEFPEYVAPSWLDRPVVEAHETELTVDALDDVIAATIWSPSGLTGPAPLLVVHDGPEYANLARFTQYLGAMIQSGALPPLRAALLDPGDRNVWYAANDDYAAAVCAKVLPALGEATVRIGIGASLGALAMLHLSRRCPHAFGALVLQSGSFFTAELDPQEAAFSGFAAVTAFVEEVTTAAADPARIAAVLTCGLVEENLANNRAITAALSRLGHRAELNTVRDGHNYTAWRDALHPHLTELIEDVTDAA
jgi:enterochelin esterase family protein